MATTPNHNIPLIEPDTLEAIAQSNDAFLVIDGAIPTSTGTELQFVDIVGTAHTLTAADAGKYILFNDAGDCTLTLPEQATETLTRGVQVLASNQGGGAMAIATEGADTVVGATTWTDPTKAATVLLITAGAPNTWQRIGD